MSNIQDLEYYFHQIEFEILFKTVEKISYLILCKNKIKVYHQHSSSNQLAGMDQNLEFFSDAWKQQTSS